MHTTLILLTKVFWCSLVILLGSFGNKVGTAPVRILFLLPETPHISGAKSTWNILHVLELFQTKICLFTKNTPRTNAEPWTCCQSSSRSLYLMMFFIHFSLISVFFGIHFNTKPLEAEFGQYKILHPDIVATNSNCQLTTSLTFLTNAQLQRLHISNFSRSCDDFWFWTNRDAH